MAYELVKQLRQAFKQDELPTEVLAQRKEGQPLPDEYYKPLTFDGERIPRRMSDTGRRYRFVLQHHQIGEGVHADLRLELPDFLMGWSLFADPGKLKDWLAGLQYLQATVKPIQPKPWLDVGKEGPEAFEPGEVGGRVHVGGKMWAVDWGDYEFGVQRKDLHEYFFHGVKGVLKGRVVFRALVVRGAPQWQVLLPDDQRPMDPLEHRDEGYVKPLPEEQAVRFSRKQFTDKQSALDVFEEELVDVLRRAERLYRRTGDRKRARDLLRRQAEKTLTIHLYNVADEAVDDFASLALLPASDVAPPKSRAFLDRAINSAAEDLMNIFNERLRALDRERFDRWTDRQGVEERAGMVADSWGKWVYASAMVETGKANDVEYVQVPDIILPNTCSYCRSIAGMVYRIDDPNKPRLPAHPNCLHTDLIPLSKQQAEAMGLIAKTPPKTVEPEPLRPFKVVSRLIAVDTALELNGQRLTVLELYAGEGHLSSEVYGAIGNHIILVDNECGKLAKARQKLDSRNCSYETYCMDNVEFIQTKMKELGPFDIVDFDPYGSPGRTIQQFFKHYDVKRLGRPLVLAVTDGAGIDLRPFTSGGASAKDMYLSDIDLDHYSKVPQALQDLLNALGREHGFSVTKRFLELDRRHRVTYGCFVVQPSRQ